MLHDSSERAARGAKRQEERTVLHDSSERAARGASGRSQVTYEAECHADVGASRRAPQAWALPIFHTALLSARGTPADGVCEAQPAVTL